ncbi:MAG: WD40/YVTN/BNR-like repeat-containing protein [Gemmatimonadota bacterium]
MRLRSLVRSLPLVALALATTLSAQQRPAPTPTKAPAKAPAKPPAKPRTTATKATAAPVLPAPIPVTHVANLRWRWVGPARGGRVTTVTGVDQEPHTFYFGSTGGGVWKTTDAGALWVNVTDGEIDVGSIGAIDVANSDPNIVYVGSGSDGYRSNVSIGRGVWKSTDAGSTWRTVGLREVGNIGALQIHPTNPDIAFVAAIGDPFRPTNARGVYRTVDGGKSWSRVLYVSDSTGAVDLEFHPTDPSILYASMWRAERKPWTIISGAREGGIYKSTDGGSTWRRLAKGLPDSLIGKSNIAVSRAAPNRVYVLMEAKPGNGLYRSDDAGESFTQVSTYDQLITRPFYYTTITADPTNADVVYAGAEGYFKSTDGGKTWNPMRTPHGDNHDHWINPRDGRIMIQANDGGVNVSLNGGKTWSTQYNQPTSEIYQVYVDNQFPYRLYGAQQDNSTLILPSLPVGSAGFDDPIQGWRSGPGCETGPIMPHPINPDTIYGSCKGQFSRMSLKTGQEKHYWVGAQSLYGNAGKDLIYRFQRVSPMEVSPHDPSVLYYGSQHVHRTRDEGVTWETISPDLTWNPSEKQGIYPGEPITVDNTGEEFFSTLYAIRESPLERGVIWTGANDGPFAITRDNGATWQRITPPGLELGGRVQNIEPSPHRKGSAYYAVLRYLLGDHRPFIYKTDDYGKTWTLLTTGTNGIPADEPVRVVREDPDRPGQLYAGTEFGAYVSFNDGKSWQSLQLNLPATPITDMKVHQKDLVISTQGRGFWILHNITPLHEAGQIAAAAQGHLFAPVTAVRRRYRTGFGGLESARVSDSDPQYPQAGATIDYWFPRDPTTEVTLDILDATGGVVRRISSRAAGERLVLPAEPSMRGPMWERIGTPRLPAVAGHNRFVWDLTLAGPWEANAQRSGRNGPTVVPGNYQVRITAGAWTATRPLIITSDPRVEADGVSIPVLQALLAHNLAVRDLVSEVNQLRADLDAALGKASGEQKQRLEALQVELEGQAWRYGRPGLADHITDLYSAMMLGDPAVGNDARARLIQLRTELDAFTPRVREAMQ